MSHRPRGVIQPTGDAQHLKNAVHLVDPDAEGEAAQYIRGLLIAAAQNYLRMRQWTAADRRRSDEERERYRAIAEHARKLMLALNSLADPDILNWEFGRMAREARIRSGGTSNMDAANLVTLPGWGEQAHPLWWIEQQALQVAEEIGSSTTDPRTFLERRHGRAIDHLASSCAVILRDETRALPSISESGTLAKVIREVWCYATCSDDPPALGGAAKEAARRLRDAGAGKACRLAGGTGE